METAPITQPYSLGGQGWLSEAKRGNLGWVEPPPRNVGPYRYSKPTLTYPTADGPCRVGASQSLLSHKLGIDCVHIYPPPILSGSLSRSSHSHLNLCQASKRDPSFLVYRIVDTVLRAQNMTMPEIAASGLLMQGTIAWLERHCWVKIGLHHLGKIEV